MTAEIISVGTELLLGNILNTNAQYLSRELADLGITVQRESTIGDNHDRLADFVNEAKSRCDLLVFTGVAGPTGGDEVRPVGTVYLGAARDGVAYVKKLFVSRPDRALVRARAAQTALELGLRLAQGKVPEGTQALTAARQSDDAALAALDRAFVRETS